ncbi:CZB domain-containing protein, partial [Methyloceanibacter sp.]|uniref:CZB domain-containing protein n=1 Tax=Methyloceanibacter sp. TaxID=1965321 RepID=UPI0039C8E0EF
MAPSRIAACRGCLAVLVCRVNPDERDTDGDAHRKCRLGQWYYPLTRMRTAVVDRLGFAVFGTEHEHMHRYAPKMLRAQASSEAVDDYQRSPAPGSASRRGVSHTEVPRNTKAAPLSRLNGRWDPPCGPPRTGTRRAARPGRS